MPKISSRYRITYAQNREDIILESFFRGVKAGVYVDIGANDPDKESVTKLFYLKGWRGINIEPQKHLFERLVEYRPEDTNLNVGIGLKDETLILRQYVGDGLSTFSESIKKEYSSISDENTDTYRDMEVRVRPLETIFKELSVGSINFMKVDVEGYEYEVLSSNNWDRWRPQVLCVEVNHVKKDCRSLLSGKGYKLVYNDGLNDYYIDSQSTDVTQTFSYVESIIYGLPIVPVAALNDLAAQDEALMDLQAQLDSRNQEIHQLREQVIRTNEHVNNVQNQLNEIISLKAHMKVFAKKKMKGVDAVIERNLNSHKAFVPVIPTNSQDLLESAHDADRSNLLKYNQNLEESQSIHVYRRLRSSVLRVTKRSKR